MSEPIAGAQAAAETGAVMATKAAPPVAVVGAKLAGIPVPDLVQWATLLYLGLMIAHKVWHMYKEWKTGKEVAE